MTLAVCPMGELDAEVARLAPAAVVSLLGPEQPLPPIRSDAPRLVLRFNDIPAPTSNLVAPTEAMVERLLAFAAAAPRDAVLLIHCWMGISRGPAAAFILACAGAPSTSEAEIATRLRRVSPSATPNPLLVRLADQALGRGGRMSAAVAQIGRGRNAAQGEAFELDWMRCHD